MKKHSWNLHPILSSLESIEFEKLYFNGDEGAEWIAMNQAGAAITHRLLRDLQEVLGEGPLTRILVLVGKGHNGGDALIAVRHLLERFPGAKAWLVFPFGLTHIRPLVRRSLDELQAKAEDRLKYLSLRSIGVEKQLNEFCGAETFELCIDGVLGMQFSPPLRAPAPSLFDWANSCESIGCRVAVDVPSGVGDTADTASFHANFSYATGIVKAGLLSLDNKQSVGRIRYLDLGFFDKQRIASTRSIASEGVLDFRRSLRNPDTHKKTFGHLFVVGGSATMPGAILMTVRSALRSGVGLVTAFVPESILAVAAVGTPEAMWVGLPEIPDDGGLALEGLAQIRALAGRATGWAIGPGMGRHPETATLVEEILKLSSAPILMDADALQPELVAAMDSGRSVVLTPHTVEFNRLHGNPLSDPISEDAVKAYAETHGMVVLLKGSPTLITDGVSIVYSSHGGPVLARGGSGDILSGLIGGRISIPGTDILESVIEGAVWHGLAADRLARNQGQVSAVATDILSFL